jgi:hypothetical protein
MSRASYLTVSEFYRLAQVVETINRAFDGTTYLVGSCTRRPDYRDVDLRMILPDGDFARFFPTVAEDSHLDGHWKLTNMAISDWIDAAAHLSRPVDFQIQSMTEANRDYPGGGRHPVRART